MLCTHIEQQVVVFYKPTNIVLKEGSLFVVNSKLDIHYNQMNNDAGRELKTTRRGSKWEVPNNKE